MSDRLLSDTALAPSSRLVGALVAAVIVVASVGVFARQVAQADTVRALYAAAIEAYDKKDYPAYLKNMEAAIAQRPVHPTFLRRLAGAYALNRRAADAAGVLRKMATLSLYYNALDDRGLRAVRGDGAVQIAARALEALRNRRIGASEVAWTIHDRLFVPEGIAYDPATGPSSSAASTNARSCASIVRRRSGFRHQRPRRPVDGVRNRRRSNAPPAVGRQHRRTGDGAVFDGGRERDRRVRVRHPDWSAIAQVRPAGSIAGAPLRRHHGQRQRPRVRFRRRIGIVAHRGPRRQVARGVRACRTSRGRMDSSRLPTDDGCTCRTMPDTSSAWTPRRRR